MYTHTSSEQHQISLPVLPCSETMNYGRVGVLPTPTPHAHQIHRSIKTLSAGLWPPCGTSSQPRKGKTHILPAPMYIFNADKSQCLQLLYWWEKFSAAPNLICTGFMRQHDIYVQMFSLRIYDKVLKLLLTFSSLVYLISPFNKLGP